MAEQNRTVRITVLFTPDEAKKIEEEAKKMALSVSAYCRCKSLQTEK